MPQSPYQKTVYAPIDNLNEYTRDLTRLRVEYDIGDDDDGREITLLDIGDELLDHCRFLEEKLQIKVP